MHVALESLPARDPVSTDRADVVLVLGYTSWSGAVRRGWIHAEDRLTLALMQSERVGRLLVCNPYRSVAAKLLRTAIGPREAYFPQTEECHLHEPLRLRRRDPLGVRAIERSYAAYERSVRRKVAAHGLERPAVITTHPLMAGFGRFDWAGPVTYYANDDLSAFPLLRPWWPAFDVAYARMRDDRRRAVALTPKALASVSPSGASAVIPCGIEPDEWRELGPAPDWFAALPSPRFLYVGTLDARVDIEQVEAISKAQPEGSIVLVGPSPDPAHYESLRQLPNVTIRPPVARAELPGLVAAADVGLIPHVRSEQTEAMSPLKLYEYLAAGAPVASIDLPGVASVSPERTALAHGTDDFVAAVQRALDLGRASDEERLAFIHDHAWGRRFELLLDVALAAN
jgi:teichuronic acid biosynthesis glycosyltransferase TuaH